MTLADLEADCAQFAKTTADRRMLANLSSGCCDEPYDVGVVVIDLVARLVVVDSTCSAPGLAGAVRYRDRDCNTDTWLRYHLAEDWQRLIDEINRHFGNLREVLETTEPSAAEALSGPVIDRFTDSLAAVALARPGPSAKCEPLTRSLTKLLAFCHSEWTCDAGESAEPA